jgi:probable rRNA maturation factor
MILLDQDLDPDPAPASGSRLNPPAHSVQSRSLRLPSLRSMAQFLRQAQDAAGLRGKVTVLLTSDESIRCLNRQFRAIDKATDVLSFPAAEIVSGLAGDLAVSVPTARRQAIEQGHSLAEEIKILILHGLLHLAGYDHEADNGKMARRERTLRGRLGLPAGLIERSGGDRPQRKPSGAKAELPGSEPMYGLKPVPSHYPKPVPSRHLQPGSSRARVRKAPSSRSNSATPSRP